jgi:hypothetical protein
MIYSPNVVLTFGKGWIKRSYIIRLIILKYSTIVLMDSITCAANEAVYQAEKCKYA